MDIKDLDIVRLCREYEWLETFEDELTEIDNADIEPGRRHMYPYFIRGEDYKLSDEGVERKDDIVQKVVQLTKLRFSQLILFAELTQYPANVTPPKYIYQEYFDSRSIEEIMKSSLPQWLKNVSIMFYNAEDITFRENRQEEILVMDDRAYMERFDSEMEARFKDVVGIVDLHPYFSIAEIRDDVISKNERHDDTSAKLVQFYTQCGQAAESRRFPPEIANEVAQTAVQTYASYITNESSKKVENDYSLRVAQIYVERVAGSSGFRPELVNEYAQTAVRAYLSARTAGGSDEEASAYAGHVAHQIYAQSVVVAGPSAPTEIANEVAQTAVQTYLSTKTAKRSEQEANVYALRVAQIYVESVARLNGFPPEFANEGAQTALRAYSSARTAGRSDEDATDYALRVAQIYVESLAGSRGFSPEIANEVAQTAVWAYSSARTAGRSDEEATGFAHRVLQSVAGLSEVPPEIANEVAQIAVRAYSSARTTGGSYEEANAYAVSVVHIYTQSVARLNEFRPEIANEGAQTAVQAYSSARTAGMSDEGAGAYAARVFQIYGESVARLNEFRPEIANEVAKTAVQAYSSARTAEMSDEGAGAYAAHAAQTAIQPYLKAPVGGKRNIHKTRSNNKKRYNHRSVKKNTITRKRRVKRHKTYRVKV